MTCDSTDTYCGKFTLTGVDGGSAYSCADADSLFRVHIFQMSYFQRAVLVTRAPPLLRAA